MRIISLFILTVIGMLYLVSCASSKTASNIDINAVVIENAFTQTVYPGREEGIIIDKLEFDLTIEDADIKADSLLYRSRIYNVVIRQDLVRINLHAGRKATESVDKLSDNDAILYLSKGKQAFTKLISNIAPKEPIYLP